jgi:hypothetical protein
VNHTYDLFDVGHCRSPHLDALAVNSCAPQGPLRYADVNRDKMSVVAVVDTGMPVKREGSASLD